MSDILFAVPDGGGVVPPILSVAGSLVRRGHTVRVLADPVLEPEVRAVGAVHVPWTTAPHRHARGADTELIRDWEARTPAGGFAMMRDAVMIGPATAFAADTLAEIDRRRPDVVASELVLFGVHLAAAKTGLPLALLHTTAFPLPAPGLPAFGSGLQPARGRAGRLRDRVLWRVGRTLWDRGLDDLNAARTALDLAPVRSVLDQPLLADRLLVLTSPAFEFPAEPYPPSVRITGARLEDPAWVAPWEPPPGDAPLVLAALSSTYQGQEPQLRRIVEALAPLPVRAVVTTGPSVDPTAIPAPDHVQLVATAPHSEVLKHAAVTIGHCGHGTTLKSLAAGVPVVCLPMGRDQLDIAARVVAAGAGVRVRGTRTTAIGRATRRVLADPTYGAAAGRLAHAIARESEQDIAADEIERLATA